MFMFCGLYSLLQVDGLQFSPCYISAYNLHNIPDVNSIVMRYAYIQGAYFH